MPVFTENFYCRVLPTDVCTAFTSPEGQDLFRSAVINEDDSSDFKNGTKSFFDLMAQFHTQTEPAYCGPSTLVMMLNTMGVDPRKVWLGQKKSCWRWYEEDMLDCCAMDLEVVREVGICLTDFHFLARCQGVTIQSWYASEVSVDQFRDAVKLACCERRDDVVSVSTDSSSSSSNSSFEQEQPKTYLVVHYNRGTLHQTGTGHFSPIAAYDERSDSVLILDTARFKYGPHWVKLELLHEAMVCIDPDCNLSRGYSLMTYHNDINITDVTSMSESSFFRSMKVHESMRQRYDEFLMGDEQSDDELSFQEVAQFWIDEESESSSALASKIWKVVQPAPLPIDEEHLKVLSSMIESIKNIVKWIPSSKLHLLKDQYAFSCCNGCKKGSRLVRLTSQEAGFMLCLASVSVQQRHAIIKEYLSNRNTDEEQVACDHLLTEAELIHQALRA